MLKDFLKGFVKASGIKECVEAKIRRLERRIEKSLLRVKKKIFRSVFELLFFLISIVMVLIGAVMFLDNYFPLEFILIGGGFISLYVAFLIGRLR